MSDALTDLRKLVEVAEKPCRCPQNPCPSCYAEEQLKSHAISIAEELVNSQVALKFARARAGIETRHWKRCCPFLRGAIAEFVVVADAALVDFEKAMVVVEDREGASPECETCGRVKVPIGRSISLAEYGSGCDRDCEGYLKDPRPDYLFPGEKQSEFGYPKETQRTCIHEDEQRMPLQSPLKSVGWLGGSSDRLVINEPARAAAEQAKGRSSS